MAGARRQAVSAAGVAGRGPVRSWPMRAAAAERRLDDVGDRRLARPGLTATTTTTTTTTTGRRRRTAPRVAVGASSSSRWSRGEMESDPDRAALAQALTVLQGVEQVARGTGGARWQCRPASRKPKSRRSGQTRPSCAAVGSAPTPKRRVLASGAARHPRRCRAGARLPRGGGGVRRRGATPRRSVATAGTGATGRTCPRPWSLPGSGVVVGGGDYVRRCDT